MFFKGTRADAALSGKTIIAKFGYFMGGQPAGFFHVRLEVVAEGIETKEQKSLLKSIGCDFGQGYHLAKPLPKKEFEMFLEK